MFLPKIVVTTHGIRKKPTITTAYTLDDLKYMVCQNEQERNAFGDAYIYPVDALSEAIFILNEATSRLFNDPNNVYLVKDIVHHFPDQPYFKKMLDYIYCKPDANGRFPTVKPVYNPATASRMTLPHDYRIRKAHIRFAERVPGGENL